jgi:hypothetical protein
MVADFNQGEHPWTRVSKAREGDQMTSEELERIRSWDKRCGDNEGTFFPVTIDRRRLLEYVDELRANLAALTRASQPTRDSAGKTMQGLPGQ